MQIAISAMGNGWDELVDPRFGRAQGFFVIDTETKETSYLDNQDNVEVGHGAGTGAAQAVVDAGVQVVLTPHVGPKAGSVLEAAGVKVLGGVDGASIQEAYQRYQAGELKE